MEYLEEMLVFMLIFFQVSFLFNLVAGVVLDSMGGLMNGWRVSMEQCYRDEIENGNDAGRS